jgi:hypothetical protein
MYYAGILTAKMYLTGILTAKMYYAGIFIFQIMTCIINFHVCQKGFYFKNKFLSKCPKSEISIYKLSLLGASHKSSFLCWYMSAERECVLFWGCFRSIFLFFFPFSCKNGKNLTKNFSINILDNFLY